MLDWERRYKKQQEDLQHYQEFVNKVGGGGGGGVANAAAPALASPLLQPL